MKNIRITLFIAIFIYITPIFSQININDNGSTVIDNSAIIEIKSINKGLLISRMTEAQRNTIGSPATGLMIFQTDGVSGFYYYNGAGWQHIKIMPNNTESLNDLSDAITEYDSGYTCGSIFIGYEAGINDDGANRNTVLGYQSMNNNTTGRYNTVMGYHAYFGNSSGGSYNIALGNVTLNNNSGSSNQAIGHQTLNANTSGNSNLALGSNALINNENGSSNVSIGNNSLQNNTSGSNNVAVGKNSMSSNLSGDSNTAVGDSSLMSGTTSRLNTAIGAKSLKSIINGKFNTSIGHHSLLSATGNNSVGLGYDAGKNTTGNGNIFLGYASGSQETGSNKLYIDNSDANSENALVYGDFNSNILRINGEFQIGNPAGTGYTFPKQRGYFDYNILQIDATGNLHLANKSDVTNNLDRCYDYGGSGAGKNIDANAGAVRINGTDGLLVTGTHYGIPIDDEITGAGIRMFFNPHKESFRAGEINGNQWDDANLGERSFATGYNTTASGAHSFASGAGSTASGNSSTAMGGTTTASGNTSTAMGHGTQSPSYAEMVVGQYNTDYTPASATSWDASDRLFVVGNGTDINSKHNAFTIKKNGNININNVYTLPPADGNPNQIITTDGVGNFLWLDDTSVGARKINDLSDGKTDINETSVFLGLNAGNADDDTQNKNIAIGKNNLVSNTSGENNTSIGTYTADSISTGSHNTILGNFAFRRNKIGSYNTVIGKAALYNDSIRSALVAVGDSALYNNGIGATQSTEAEKNTAIGYKSLFYNTTGSRNTAFGCISQISNEQGTKNSSFGYATFGNAGYNISFGFQSLAFNRGWSNVGIGFQALFSYDNDPDSSTESTNGSHNIAIGTASLFKNYDMSKSIAIGDSTLYNNEYNGVANTAIGFKAVFGGKDPISNHASCGNANTATGSYALQGVMHNSASGNTANGYQALNALNRDTYFSNVAFGAYALLGNGSGDGNIAIGVETCRNVTKDNNIGIGRTSGFANVYGTGNIMLGYETLYSNQNGDSNVAIGSRALYNDNVHSHLVAVGDSALYNNIRISDDQDGTSNTAIGSKALFSNTIGKENTAIGINALYNNTTGVWNTAIGPQANYNGNYSNTMAIGENVAVYADHEVRIGNNAVTSIGGPVGWTNLSDGRFKTQITSNVPGLKFIMKLRPVTYRLQIDKLDEYQKIHRDANNKSLYDKLALNASGKTYSGFIAQEVEKAAQSINYDFSGVDAPGSDSDLYGLRYAEFVMPLVKAAQEQMKQINQLKDKTEDIKSRIVRVEKILDNN